MTDLVILVLVALLGSLTVNVNAFHVLLVPWALLVMGLVAWRWRRGVNT